MDENKKHLDDLVHIRSLMERSSQFLSLSGLSGVFAGIYALIGAAVVYFDFGGNYRQYARESIHQVAPTDQSKKLLFLITIAIIVLVASLLTGYILSSRKAQKNGLKIWDNTAKRMMLNLFVPLIAGGILCMIMMSHGMFGFVAPLTLLFYGLGLYSASKFSFVELKYLGLSEIILGLVAMYYYGMGLLFWSIGFGLLHILYGAWMYFKYEKKS